MGKVARTATFPERSSWMLPYSDEHAGLLPVADTSLEDVLSTDFIMRFATPESSSAKSHWPENQMQTSDSARRKRSSCHAKKSLTEFPGKATEELPGIKEPSEEMITEIQMQTSDSGRKKCSSCHAKKSLTEFSGKATCDRCPAKKPRLPMATDSSIQLEVPQSQQGRTRLSYSVATQWHFKLQEQAETAPLKCSTFIATVPVHTGLDTQNALSMQAAAYSTVGEPRQEPQLCPQAQSKGQTALFNSPLGPLIDQGNNSNNSMSCYQKCSSCNATRRLIEFSGKATRTCERCRTKKRKRRKQQKAELKMQGISTNLNGHTQNSNGRVHVTHNSTLNEYDSRNIRLVNAVV